MSQRYLSFRFNHHIPSSSILYFSCIEDESWRGPLHRICYSYIQVCTRCCSGFSSSCQDTWPLVCEVFHFLPRWWAKNRSFPPLDDCWYKGIRAVPIEIRNRACLRRHIVSFESISKIEHSNIIQRLYVCGYRFIHCYVGNRDGKCLWMMLLFIFW